MIFDFWNMDFSDEDWIYIIAQYLKEWTEIPLSTSSGYNVEEIKFFDGLIGTLLKQTERICSECPDALNQSFVDSWIYQGKLYRVMHGYVEYNEIEGEKYVLPKVEYHGMISHWTDDYTFEGLTYKLSHDEKYIILEADTKDHLAFDVNKFRKAYGCERPFTEKEREIIFPMYKENIKEYQMTISEFVELKNQEGLI